MQVSPPRQQAAMHRFTPPPGYERIKVVHSFAELAATPFQDGVNAICWLRDLPGDFDEVVAALQAQQASEGSDSFDSIEAEQLQSLHLSEQGRIASVILQQDLALLRQHGMEPSLDCIHAYARDDASAIIATDVYSFHVDSAPVAAETWLCAYTQAASEGLRNDQAQKKIDLPATRAALLQEYGGKEGPGFLAFLHENCYDLHYAPAPDAQPFSFGLGNLWRIAIEYPACPVPPCIHRAPETMPDQPARLLLIS
jgi:hypothetical protein